MEEAATQEIAAARPARPPPRAHATTLLYLLALVHSVVAWTRVGRDPFVIDRRAFWGEPWRIFTARFVHASAPEFVIGLLGTAIFGRMLERRIGTARMFGICALLVFGIGLAEQAFDRGGLGLTSVVCGIWATIVAGSLRDPALRGVVPISVSLLMITAFLLCIFAPQVSNWGHAAGLAIGVCAGLCLDRAGNFSLGFLPLALLLLLALSQGATRWRASWNSGGASVELRHAGVAALDRGDEPLAEKELRGAIAFDRNDGNAWWSLGSVLARTGRTEDAADACWNAYQSLHVLEPDERSYLEQALRWSLAQRMESGDGRRAFEHARRLVQLAPNDLDAWSRLRDLAFGLGEDEWHGRAERECARLSPEQH